MFAIERIADVPEQLGRVYADRLAGAKYPEASLIRGPVGLFLVRKDGAAGSKLAEEVVGSYKYWSDRSSYFFDGVFLGWGFDAGIPVFSEPLFQRCIADLES